MTGSLQGNTGNQGNSSLRLEGPPDALVMIANRSYHYYAGSAYLGLQSHPSVLAATCEATLRYGTGTGTTRFALTAPPVFDVEHLAAKYLGVGQSFYHGSESFGPHILLETLGSTFDRIFVDEAADKRIFQAVKSWQTKTRPIVFRHNDPDNLQLELRKHLKPAERPIVMTNGVFAMSGKIAPLDRYAMILSSIEGASLLVDDSHGFGVLGAYGHGVFEHFGVKTNQVNQTTQDASEMPCDFESGELPFDVFPHAGCDFEENAHDDDMFPHKNRTLPHCGHLNREGHSSCENRHKGSFDGLTEPSIMSHLPVRYYHSASLTKAIGGSGGIIAGSQLFIERLVERLGAFADMAAPSSPLAAGTAEGINMTFRTDALRRKLRENTHYFKKKISVMGLPTDSSDVPIVPITLGTAGNMRRIQQRLSERGVLVSYIPRGPGLPNDGTLRITIFASHTTEMLDHLIKQLEQAL